MAVTVARYQTPALKDINKVGIKPDKWLPTALKDVLAEGPEKVCSVLEQTGSAEGMFEGAPRKFDAADPFDELDDLDMEMAAL